MSANPVSASLGTPTHRGRLGGRRQGVPSVPDPGRSPRPSRPWLPTASNRSCVPGSRWPLLRSAAGSMSGSTLQETRDDGDDQAGNGQRRTRDMRHVGVPFASSESADPGRSDPEAAGPVLSRICASGTRVFWMCLKVFRGMNLLVAVFVTDHGPINGQAGLCPRLAFRCCR